MLQSEILKQLGIAGLWQGEENIAKLYIPYSTAVEKNLLPALEAASALGWIYFRTDPPRYELNYAPERDRLWQEVIRAESRALLNATAEGVWCASSVEDHFIAHKEHLQPEAERALERATQLGIAHSHLVESRPVYDVPRIDSFDQPIIELRQGINHLIKEEEARQIKKLTEPGLWHLDAADHPYLPRERAEAAGIDTKRCQDLWLLRAPEPKSDTLFLFGDALRKTLDPKIADEKANTVAALTKRRKGDNLEKLTDAMLTESPDFEATARAFTEKGGKAFRRAAELNLIERKDGSFVVKDALFAPIFAQHALTLPWKVNSARAKPLHPAQGHASTASHALVITKEFVEHAVDDPMVKKLFDIGLKRGAISDQTGFKDYMISDHSPLFVALVENMKEIHGLPKTTAEALRQISASQQQRER